MKKPDKTKAVSQCFCSQSMIELIKALKTFYPKGFKVYYDTDGRKFYSFKINKSCEKVVSYDFYDNAWHVDKTDKEIDSMLERVGEKV